MKNKDNFQNLMRGLNDQDEEILKRLAIKLISLTPSNQPFFKIYFKQNVIKFGRQYYWRPSDRRWRDEWVGIFSLDNWKGKMSYISYAN